MSLNSSKVIMESPLMSASITISWRSSLERLIPSRVKTNLISDVDMYPLPSSNISCYFISRHLYFIYLVKDPEDLLEIILGLLLIFPLHHQVDKLKEVHSTRAVFVSLLKKTLIMWWQSSPYSQKSNINVHRSAPLVHPQLENIRLTSLQLPTPW
mgnify:CR=1 FL=1